MLTVEGENLFEPEIKRHVAHAGFKVLGEGAPETPVTDAEQKSFWQTYKPLLLVIGYLLGVVGLVEITAESFDWMRAMGNFMGAFFLAFSFLQDARPAWLCRFLPALRRDGPPNPKLRVCLPVHRTGPRGSITSSVSPRWSRTSSHWP
jgi:hypothetical protein